jgi:hypothetical protein
MVSLDGEAARSSGTGTHTPDDDAPKTPHTPQNASFDAQQSGAPSYAAVAKEDDAGNGEDVVYVAGGQDGYEEGEGGVQAKGQGQDHEEADGSRTPMGGHGTSFLAEKSQRVCYAKADATLDPTAPDAFSYAAAVVE